MRILVSRHHAIGQATIGTMTINSERSSYEQFSCFTLEDTVRSTKIAGETAIPAGDYPVCLSKSPRFSKSYKNKGYGWLVPEVLNVPNFTDIRIHIGNTAVNTEGCILVGEQWDGKSASIGKSGDAYGRLVKLLATATYGIRITITDHLAQPGATIFQPPKTLFQLLHGSSAGRSGAGAPFRVGL